jgi:cobalt-zinc-cadmium efflux system outer membrane protein
VKCETTSTAAVCALSVVALSTLVGLSSVACADDSAPLTISVREMLGDPARLVAFVSTHQGDVHAAASRVEQARADLAQSRLRPNPSLSLGLSDLALGATNPPGLGFNDTAIYGVTLTQTFEIGKRGPRTTASTLRAAATQDSYLDAVTDRVAAARAALGRIVFLGERQRALEESLTAAVQVVGLQKTRFEKGDLSGNDYDRLLLDTSALETDVRDNRNELEAAFRDCATVLRARCDASGSEAQWLEEATLPSRPPLDLEGVLDARPDLRSLGRQEEAALADAQLAHNRRIPDPALSVGYTRDRLVISGDQPKTIGFSLAIPLPAFDRGQNDAAKAKAHAQELHEMRAVARAQARGEIENLRARQTFLQGALATLRDDSVPRSRRVLESTVNAVNSGEVGMTDLLLARRTHIELTLRLLQLQKDAFDVATDLRHALALDADLVPRKAQVNP